MDRKLCVEDQVFIISIVESVEQSSAIKTHFGGKDWELIDFSCSSKTLTITSCQNDIVFIYQILRPHLVKYSGTYKIDNHEDRLL